jgi:hypothetical protein
LNAYLIHEMCLMIDSSVSFHLVKSPHPLLLLMPLNCSWSLVLWPARSPTFWICVCYFLLSSIQCWQLPVKVVLDSGSFSAFWGHGWCVFPMGPQEARGSFLSQSSLYYNWQVGLERAAWFPHCVTSFLHTFRPGPIISLVSIILTFWKLSSKAHSLTK